MSHCRQNTRAKNDRNRELQRKKKTPWQGDSNFYYTVLKSNMRNWIRSCICVINQTNSSGNILTTTALQMPMEVELKYSWSQSAYTNRRLVGAQVALNLALKRMSNDGNGQTNLINLAIQSILWFAIVQVYHSLALKQKNWYIRPTNARNRSWAKWA